MLEVIREKRYINDLGLLYYLRRGFCSSLINAWDCCVGYSESLNLGARYRWGIEDSMNTEKNRGYCYEHVFSHNWNAMRCFHSLMRMAHLLNELVQRTRSVKKHIRQLGIAGYWKLVKSTLSGLWLTSEWMGDLLTAPFQLRLE